MNVRQMAQTGAGQVRTVFATGLLTCAILTCVILTCAILAWGIIFVGSTSLQAQGAQTATRPSATHTSLQAETREVNGRTIVTAALSVIADSDTAATGSATLLDHGKPLAGAALNAEGKATFTVEGFTAGDHSLRAVYNGDSLHQASKSESAEVIAQATTVVPDFTLAISATTLTLAAPGDAGSLVATVTPNSGTGFTGFLSLSCSGPSLTSGAPGGSALPYGVSCTFNPANLEVTAPTTANATGAQSASLSIQSTAPAGTQSQNRPMEGLNGRPGHLALAVLLPGLLGLGFLGRKRGILGRGALLLTFAAITLLGTSACAPRYKYFHHPPTYNAGTPTGTYTITVTAQTSNGVTATEHSQTLALTIQ